MHQFPLTDHPIFSLPHERSTDSELGPLMESVGLEAALQPSNVMVMRGSDLVLAVGNEIRIANVVDAKATGTSQASYKVLNTPNITFNIKQIALNPEGKFLAVSGSHELVVVILPRAGYSRLMTTQIECKSMPVGRYFHGPPGAPRIAKLGWHPWGRGGSSLLVLTTDGTFREYDVSSQVEEPLQTLQFLEQRAQRRGFRADMDADQLVSFCFGKGSADWGPLTVYGLAKSGDIYGLSPFIPTYADIPCSYLLGLESFVKVKREHATSATTSIVPTFESANYDMQYKYATTLAKQAVASLAGADSQNRLAHIRRPEQGRLSLPPARQGPFVLQPSPAEFGETLEGACDVSYVLYETSSSAEEGSESTSNLRMPPEKGELGAFLVSHADGRVDVMLDVEKVEAVWYHESHLREALPSPTLVVYETVDLGLAVHARDSNAESLLSQCRVATQMDPMNPCLLYAFHSCGVHALNLQASLEYLCSVMSRNKALDKREENHLITAIQKAPSTEVECLLDTFSPEERSAAPVIAIAVTNNLHLGHTLLALTVSLQLVPVFLELEDVSATFADLRIAEPPVTDAAAYLSITTRHPYRPPPLTATDLKTGPRDPGSRYMSGDTLRKFGKQAERVYDKSGEIQDNVSKLEIRTALQMTELRRQLDTLRSAQSKLSVLRSRAAGELQSRVANATEMQRSLFDRIARLKRGCTDQSSLTLSDAEMEWFAELERLARSVDGGDGTGSTLHERADKVQYRYKMLSGDGRGSGDTPSPKTAALGSAQRKAIEQSLQKQTRMLEEARTEAEALAAKLR